MRLGDMLIVDAPPAKLMKALAVVADRLHSTFDTDSKVIPGKSKESCILSSLAVRDFLWKLGFKSATVAPCVLAIRALKGDDLVHSVGLGGDIDPALPLNGGRPDGWWGHLVVHEPESGFLIDTTMYQAIRPQWPNMPGMIALPLAPDGNHYLNGKPILAGMTGNGADGADVDMIWIHRPENKGWKDAPDFERNRRAPAVKAMRAAFGEWQD